MTGPQRRVSVSRSRAVEGRGLLGASRPGPRCVDDLVGHPHQRVDVAHVRAHRLGQQPRGRPERRRVGADHHRRARAGHLVVALVRRPPRPARGPHRHPRHHPPPPHSLRVAPNDRSTPRDPHTPRRSRRSPRDRHETTAHAGRGGRPATVTRPSRPHAGRGARSASDEPRDHRSVSSPPPAPPHVGGRAPIGPGLGVKDASRRRFAVAAPSLTPSLSRPDQRRSTAGAASFLGAPPPTARPPLLHPWTGEDHLDRAHDILAGRSICGSDVPGTSEPQNDTGWPRIGGGAPDEGGLARR